MIKSVSCWVIFCPYNHNYNYTSTLQTVPKEGSQTRTLPLQVYNYNHNYNYTSTLQTVPKEGGPPRAKPLQTHNHNYNYSTTLQKIEEKRLPVSVIKANQWKLLLPTKPLQTHNHNYNYS